MEESIADWFEWWTWKGHEARQRKIELGQWLYEDLSGVAKNRVREMVREHLIAVIRTTHDPEVLTDAAERLESVSPDDPYVERLAEAVADGGIPQWAWPLIIFVMAGTITAAALWFLLGS